MEVRASGSALGRAEETQEDAIPSNFLRPDPPDLAVAGIRGRDAFLFAFVLMLISESITDFITGATPVLPAPLALFILIPVVPVFAGLGLVLVRETALRWRKGWLSVLLLGGALGLVREGLFDKVIFAPASFASVGYLGTYGHWLGVNWVLAVLSLLFEGPLSCAVPIFLVSRLFPRFDGVALLPGRMIWLGLAAFAVVVALVYVFVPPPTSTPLAPAAFVYSPPSVDVISVIVAVAACAYVAWRIPADALAPVAPHPRVGRAAAVLIGLGYSGGILLLGGPLPHIVPWPQVLILAMVLLALGTLLILRRWFGREDNTRHLAALVAGALIPYCITSIFLTAGGDFGALPIALALVALAIYAGRKRPAPGESPLRLPPPASTGSGVAHPAQSLSRLRPESEGHDR